MGKKRKAPVRKKEPKDFVNEALKFVSRMENPTLKDVFNILERLRDKLRQYEHARGSEEELRDFLGVFLEEVMTRVFLRDEEITRITDTLLDIVLELEKSTPQKAEVG